MLSKLLRTKNDWTLTLIRVVAGGVMLPHGLQKLLGWYGGAGFTNQMAFFSHVMGIPAWLAFLVIVAESFGALGMILGFLSRIAAFGIVADMIGAVLLVHRHFGLFMNWAGSAKGEGIEFHFLMIAMALSILIWGGGAFSVDHALSSGGEQ